MRIKTATITTILTSAYLSTMLTSSLAPIRNNTIFAAAVDSTAAEKALQNAVSGLDVAGWAASASATPVIPPPVVQSAVPDAPPKADPVLTEELVARLIKYTRASTTGFLSASVCKVLDLCDGTANMPIKNCQSDSTDGDHFFAVPVPEDSKDIIFVVSRPKFAEIYLTDKTGKLRAAVYYENKAARLLLNEKAAEKFKVELTLWAGEALTLPPTTATAPGNS